jgi:hypothetical protein
MEIKELKTILEDWLSEEHDNQSQYSRGAYNMAEMILDKLNDI